MPTAAGAYKADGNREPVVSCSRHAVSAESVAHAVVPAEGRVLLCDGRSSAEQQNTFHHGYTVLACVGAKAGMGLAAVELVREAMANPNPLAGRTGVPPCGKPTTGVTIRPWTGIFMLHGLSSPESYFQAAFRVQSPWAFEGADWEGRDSRGGLPCVRFRVEPCPQGNLRLQPQSERGRKQSGKEGREVREVPTSCPMTEAPMNRMDAEEILQWVMSGTTATMLARKAAVGSSRQCRQRCSLARPG